MKKKIRFRLFDPDNTLYPPACGLFDAIVLDRLGGEGTEAVLVEDLSRNLPPARDPGVTTILVDGRAAGGAAD